MSSSTEPSNHPPDQPNPAQDRWRLALLIALTMLTGEEIGADSEPETDYPTVHSFAYLVYWLRHKLERIKSALRL